MKSVGCVGRLWRYGTLTYYALDRSINEFIMIFAQEIMAAL
jgi:hypothetical protein